VAPVEEGAGGAGDRVVEGDQGLAEAVRAAVAAEGVLLALQEAAVLER